MNLYHIYLPILRDGNKVAHAASVWSDFEACLLENFGGFTRLPEVSGAWLDDSGSVVPDHSRRYAVGIPEDKEYVLRRLVERCKETFDQQCIFVGKVGTAELV